MTTPSSAPPAPDFETAPLPLEEELSFYGQYGWCLNAFPTVFELSVHLREETERLQRLELPWTRAEAMINVFLLSCGISGTTDDYLLGPHYDFSRAVNVFRPCRQLAAAAGAALRMAASVRDRALQRVSNWRDEWEGAVSGFMRAFASESAAAAPPVGPLLSLLERRLPGALLSARPHIPAAFRSQDLTHFDVFRLGGKFIEAYPDRSRPVLVVGLRTAGSYFAPLLRGYLEAEGYGEVASVTLRPKQGAGSRERACLERAASRGALAAIVDEPVYSAGTVARGLGELQRAGFRDTDVAALFAVHPNRRDWNTSSGRLALSSIRVLTLEPEEWHKHGLLESDAAPARICEYLRGRTGATVSAALAGPLTARMHANREPGFHNRLKRVYEIGPGSRKRYVVAKSVGWGWLGYHAFVAGTRLDGLVPRVLGLRDGILYTEWRAPDDSGPDGGSVRGRAAGAAASYIASRVRKLALEHDPAPGLMRAGRHRGSEELAGILSEAYGSKIAAALKRPRIQDKLMSLPRGPAALIDGKMRPLEWVNGGGALVKSDFEHHGMGKHQLNITDAAFDLADTILQWNLSEDEERGLLDGYAEISGDRDAVQRLFLYKLLAGRWAMARAADSLRDPRMWARREEYNRCYQNAARFLTLHTMRFCAAHARRPDAPRWSSPLAVLDVDGVIDRQVFGFPSTTAAGIKALSLLASHGIAVALNTARSVEEMKEYSRAYGFAGGVAEYGSFVWDAVSGREQVLASVESLEQMEQLKARLREIPGVFLNDAYRFSVRCYAYARERTVPVPEMLIADLIARLGLDRLKLHQTYTDSTVTAAGTDKGTGLRALLALAGRPDLETIAVGDTEPDLPLFFAAGRCFAPAQISCPEPARLLGCRIASRPYQAGLLEIARSITHPRGGRCANCLRPVSPAGPADSLFFNLLHLADRSRLELLVRSLFDPKAVRAFAL